MSEVRRIAGNVIRWYDWYAACIAADLKSWWTPTGRPTKPKWRPKATSAHGETEG